MEKDILLHIQSQPFDCSSITPKMDRYIKQNFKKIESSDFKGRNWYKVYRVGNDAKYGHYMVCLDSKEYRNSTEDEFYNGKSIYKY